MSSLPILLYLSASLVVGLLFSVKRDKSAADYFYAGENAGAITLGSSLVLSNILRYQIVLLPLVALRSFWIAAAASIVAVVCSYRFGRPPAPGASRTAFGDSKGSDLFVVGIVFISSITIQIAGTMALADLILRNTLNLEFSTTVLLMIVFAGIYAIVGGFAAVAQTQILQLVVFFGGLVGLAILGSVPGPGRLAQSFSPLTSVTLAGGVLGLPVMSLWIWHYDRFSLQQVNSSKDAASLQRGLFIAGSVVVAALLIVLLAGNVSAGLTLSPAAHILSLVCVASLMASFAASFTSASESMAAGFLKTLNPSSPEPKLILVGRLTTAAVIALTIVMIPLVQSMGTRLIDLFVAVQACLFPPVTAIYIARLVSGPAPMAGLVPALVAGESAGVIRLLLHAYGADGSASAEAFSWILSMDVFLFAFCLFAFSLVVLYGAGVVVALRLRAAHRLT